MSEFITSNLPTKNNTTILGADINTSIGTRPTNPHLYLPGKQEDERDTDPIIDLLGPFGNSHKSKPEHCDRILNIMREHNLRAASTFFDNNKKYNTWLAPPKPESKKRRAYQIDHIFIPKNQLCHTTNVKRRFNGAHSDHAAL